MKIHDQSTVTYLVHSLYESTHLFWYYRPCINPVLVLKALLWLVLLGQLLLCGNLLWFLIFISGHYKLRNQWKQAVLWPPAEKSKMWFTCLAFISRDPFSLAMIYAWWAIKLGEKKKIPLKYITHYYGVLKNVLFWSLSNHPKHSIATELKQAKCHLEHLRNCIPMS